jgi:hypothetical protein
VDSVRNLTSTAVAFECEPYLCNPRLLGSLVKKLPEIKLASWSIHLRVLRTQFLSLIDFAEWLEEAGRKVEEIYDPLEEIKDIGRSENPQQVKKNKVFAAADQPTERKSLFCKTAGTEFLNAQNSRMQQMKNDEYGSRNRNAALAVSTLDTPSKNASPQGNVA